jgi:hypothetical protein
VLFSVISKNGYTYIERRIVLVRTVQISTNYEHNIIGFVVLSIARAISDTILLVVKEITRINKRNRLTRGQ